jgi:hypothetical protein
MAKHYALTHKAEDSKVSVHRVRASIESLIPALTPKEAKQAMFDALVKMVKNIPGYDSLAVNTSRVSGRSKSTVKRVTTPKIHLGANRKTKPKKVTRVTKDKGVGKTVATKNSRVSLSQQNIRDIRQMFKEMMATGDNTKWPAITAIAEKFKTSPTNVHLIVERKTWRNVE